MTKQNIIHKNTDNLFIAKARSAAKQNDPKHFCLSHYMHWTNMAAEANLQAIKYRNFKAALNKELKTTSHFMKTHDKIQIQEKIKLLDYNIEKMLQTAELYLYRANLFKASYAGLGYGLLEVPNTLEYKEGKNKQ